MIKKIILKNFQSHKKTEIDLNSKTNCIVGPSHKGKSSIIRALHFFFTNDWKKDYLRKGKTNTEITLVLDNGFKITRIKGNKNDFIIEKDGKTEEFESIGRGDIPEEVRKVLNYNPEYDFNIARQNPYDMDFLMTETSSERSSIFSKILKLDRIEDAMDEVNSDIYNLKREKNSEKEELEKLKEEVKEYDWLEDAENLIDKNKDKIKKLKDKHESKKELEKLKNDYKNLIKKLKKLKNKFDKIEIDVDLTDIEKRIENIEDFKELKMKFSKIKNKIKDNKDKIDEVKNKREKVENEIGEFLQNVDSCPFCLSDITEDKRERIKSNL